MIALLNMKIRKADPKYRKEALKITRELKEWFDKNAREKQIPLDFKLNNLVVALEKEKVIGFLCYTSYSGKMQLIWIGVKKEFQRKGIGKKLLTWLEEESKKLKLHYIEVETLSEKYKYKPYEITRNFYYKNGFKKIANKKQLIKDWDDLIVLAKLL